MRHELFFHRVFAPAAAVAALLLTTAALQADEVTVRGIPYKNVQIIDIQRGKLVYMSAAGERQVNLADVDDLKVSQYPDLAKADKTLEKRPGSAARILGRLSRRGPSWFKKWATYRYIKALDADGQYDRAMTQYLRLVDRDDDPFFVSAMPRNIPDDPEKRKKVAKIIEDALKSTRNKQLRKQLQPVLKALESGEKPAAASLPEQAKRTNTRRNTADPQGGAIGEALKAKQWKKALTMIEAELKGRRPQYPRLYHQKGLAHQGLGQHMNAALAFMRVVIEYRGTNWAYMATVEAGKAFKALEEKQHAKRLWEEAKMLAGDDKEKLKQIDSLLAQL